MQANSCVQDFDFGSDSCLSTIKFLDKSECQKGASASFLSLAETSVLIKHIQKYIFLFKINTKLFRLPKCYAKCSTGSLLTMALTKAQVSMVQDRTVSVRPSLNRRVMDASYVKQNFPLSYKNAYKC